MPLSERQKAGSDIGRRLYDKDWSNYRGPVPTHRFNAGYGKDFNGWQKQPNKLNIQGEIEKAIGELTGEEIELIASGRTDAGVHSLGQTANFKTNSKLNISKFPVAINSKLKHRMYCEEV